MSVSRPIKKIKLVKSLCKHIGDLKQAAAFTEKFKEMSASYSEPLAHLLKIVEEISTEVGQATGDSSAKKVAITPSEKLILQIKSLIDSIQTISKNLNSPDKGKEEKIVVSIISCLNQIPAVLDAFNNLDLATKIKKSLPQSIQHMKKGLEQVVSGMFSNLVLKEEKFKTSVYALLRESNEQTSIEEFKQLDGMQQNIQLLVLQDLNSAVREFMLFVDKIGIQSKILEGYFTTKPLLVLQGYQLEIITDEFKDNEAKDGVVYVKRDGESNLVYIIRKTSEDVQTETIENVIAEVKKEEKKEEKRNIDSKYDSALIKVKPVTPLTLEQVTPHFSDILQHAQSKNYIKLNTIQSLCKRISEAYESRMKIAKSEYKTTDINECYPYNESITKQRNDLISITTQYYKDAKEKVKQEAICEVKKLIELLKESKKLSDASNAIIDHWKNNKWNTQKACDAFKDIISVLKRNNEEKKALKEIADILKIVHDANLAEQGIETQSIKDIDQVNERTEKIVSPPSSLPSFTIKVENVTEVDVKKEISKSKSKAESKSDKKVENKWSTFSLLEKSANLLKDKFRNTQGILALYALDNNEKKDAEKIKDEKEIKDENKKNEQVDESIFIKIIKNTTKARAELKSVMDEKVYQFFFEKREVEGKVIEDRPNHWIRHLADAIDGLHGGVALFQEAFNVKEEKKAERKEEKRVRLEAKNVNNEVNKTPGSEIESSMDLVSKGIDSVQEMGTSVTFILRNSELREITSLSGLTKMVSGITEPLDLFYQKQVESIAELSEKPFAGMVAELAQKKGQGKNESEKVALFIEKVKKIVGKFPQSKDSITAVSLSEFAKFAITNLDDIMILIANAELSLASIQSIATHKMIELVHEFNDKMRDVFVALDALETKMYLKPGYLTKQFKVKMKVKDKEEELSLSDVVGSMHVAFAKKFEFKPEDDFPYYDMRRQKLMALKHPDIEHDFHNDYIDRRASLMQNETMKNKNKQSEQLSDSVMNLRGGILVNQRHEELLAESLSAVKLTKRELLLELAKNKGSGRERLNKVFASLTPDKKKNMYLLYQGRTAKTMEYLQELIVTKQDVLNRLDLEIEECKQAREKNYYVSVGKKRTMIEEKYHALTLLRELYNHQGYSFGAPTLIDQGALAILQTKHKKSYDFLYANHLPLLQELGAMDNTIDPSERGRIEVDLFLNHYVEKKESKPTVAASSLDSKHDKLKEDKLVNPAIGLINSRIKDLNNAWFATTCRARKIELLTYIRAKVVDESHSVNDAIASLRMHPNLEYSSNVYLLFEGRTGRMMKQIQYQCMLKEDIAQRIQVEILRLQSQRTDKLYFFAQRRKLTLETRIEALVELRKNVLEYGSYTKAMDKVSPAMQAVLRDNEDKLLQDLQLWSSEGQAKKQNSSPTK